MQPLNHDMDELMRRAAADYPVKPHGMDWEKVAQQLTSAGIDAASVNRYGGLKKLLLLLPFVFASFVCDRFLQQQYGDLKKMEGAKQTTHAATNNNLINASKGVATAIRTQRIEQAIQLITAQAQKQGSRNPILKSSVVSNPTSVTEDGISSASVSTPATYRQANLATTLPRDLKNGLAVPVAQNQQPITITATPAVPKSSRTNKSNATEKLSVSLLFGPDFSSVKGQKTKPAGYSVGIVADYQLSRRLALESGVFWDRKNYYSDGEYFKTNKIVLPEYTTVVQVEGYCAMFEIPVNVRYTVLQKGSNALFISGGLSSYLMHNENYDYVVQRYGVTKTGNADYKHASKNWFSVANLNVSYEHQFGSKIKLRLEPYLKLPVNGVGIGSLPINSAGVLVGLSYPIH